MDALGTGANASFGSEIRRWSRGSLGFGETRRDFLVLFLLTHGEIKHNQPHFWYKRYGRGFDFAAEHPLGQYRTPRST
eukprot:1001599-Rhodomonas_salina.3